MILVSVPWFVAVAYWLCFTICWRTLTGHMAWAVHRSSGKPKTIKPPVENWICSAVPCGLLSLLWFVVLLFAVPWPWKKGDEAVAEVFLKKIDLSQLEAKSLLHEERTELEWDRQFEHLTGEVED